MTPQEALTVRIAEVETAIWAIEERPGRRTGAERAEIAERSRYLGGLRDAYQIVYGATDDTQHQVTIAGNDADMLRLIDGLELAVDRLAPSRERAQLVQLRTELNAATKLVAS